MKLLGQLAEAICSVVADGAVDVDIEWVMSKSARLRPGIK